MWSSWCSQEKIWKGASLTKPRHSFGLRVLAATCSLALVVCCLVLPVLAQLLACSSFQHDAIFVRGRRRSSVVSRRYYRHDLCPEASNVPFAECSAKGYDSFRCEEAAQPAQGRRLVQGGACLSGEGVGQQKPLCSLLDVCHSVFHSVQIRTRQPFRDSRPPRF